MVAIGPSVQRHAIVGKVGWHVTQRSMRHSVPCDTAWACPQVPVAVGTAAAPLPAHDFAIGASTWGGVSMAKQNGNVGKGHEE